MPSTVIRAYGYDPAKRELSILFQSGRRYIYLDVPEMIFIAMKSSFSKGDYFNHNVREHFEFRRVPESQGLDAAD